MTNTIKVHDFVEIDYTGKLADETVFDTTSEKVAKENNIHAHKQKYHPAVICVGERQVLPGLDSQLVDKEIGKEYTVTLPAEKAFGKRDIKKVKIMPMDLFRQHKVQPHPGLQVDVDGEMGIVNRVSGGRVIVNFNHPLAGKEVIYSYKILRKVTDQKEKITAFLTGFLRLPAEAMKIEVKDNAATVTIPGELPTQISTIIAQKLVQLTGLKDILFKREEAKHPQHS